MASHTSMTALLVVCTAVFVPPSVHAGGWTQSPGHFYLKVWDRAFINGGSAYVADTLGRTESIASFSDHQFSLYGEVGVHSRVTVVAALTPVGLANVGDESTVYMGPLVFGARVGLLQGDVPLAIEVHYGYTPSIGEELLFDRVMMGSDGVERRIVYVPTVENHRVEAQLQVGRGFRLRETNAWFTASLGARANTGYRSALTAFAQVGFQPWRFTFDLHVGLYEPFFGDIALTNASGAGNTRYLGVGIGIAFAITDNIGLTLGAEGVLYAQSNAATSSWLFGIEARR